MTETQALERCRDGDPQAFRHLVDQHQDVLFRTATLMTGSQSLAEVQVRKALHSAWHGLRAVRCRAPVKPWLVRILVRQDSDRDPRAIPSVRPSHYPRLRHLPPPLGPGETDPQRHQVRRAFGSLGPADRHCPDPVLLRRSLRLPTGQRPWPARGRRGAYPATGAPSVAQSPPDQRRIRGRRGGSICLGPGARRRSPRILHFGHGRPFRAYRPVGRS